MLSEALQERISLFLKKSKADQTAILFSAYLLAYLLLGKVIYYPLFSGISIMIMLSVTLVFREHLFTAWFWLVALVFSLSRIVLNWHDAPNHHYVIAYGCLLLTLVYSRPVELRDDFLKRQARYIVAIILFFAGLQKLISPEYRNGSVLELMFLLGHMSTFILNTEMFYAHEMAINNEVLLEFGSNFSSDAQARFFWYSPFFHSIAQALAWIIIVSEMAAGTLMLRYYDKLWFQALMLAFVTVIFLFSPEGGFLALLLIFVWSQLPSAHQRIHSVLVCFFLLILTLQILKISDA